jgi:hypothetical protein
LGSNEVFEKVGLVMFGDQQIQIGRTKVWTAGPIDVLACRQQGEIKIGRRQLRPATAFEIEVQVDSLDETVCSSFATTRFSSLERTSDIIHISPATAPTPLVVSLREPVVLRPNSITPVFVSTPVWIAFSAKAGTSPFYEIPSLELKQTWFGPNRREGELCLSCTNQGTIHADYVTHHPLRVLTRLNVHQSGDRPFHLEKLKLPLPSLKLYRDNENHLHTDGLRVTIENDRVQLNIAKELRLDGSDSVNLIAKARKKGSTGLERALSAMLG